MSKWINCRKCGHRYDSVLSVCPECSCPTLSFKKIMGIAAIAVILTVALIGIALGFSDKGSSDDKIISSEALPQESVTENSSLPTDTEVTSSEAVTSSEDATPSSVIAESASSSSEESTSKESEPSESVISTPSQESATSSVAPVTTQLGTVLQDGKAYVTVPEFYLRKLYDVSDSVSDMSFEEFAYSMTDEEKQKGCLSVTKNSDGSSTIVVTAEYYAELRAESQKQCRELISVIEAQTYVKKTANSNDFDGVAVVITKNMLTEKEKELFELAGLSFLYNQYLIPESGNKCSIEVLYGTKKLETFNFPDIFITK